MSYCKIVRCKENSKRYESQDDLSNLIYYIANLLKAEHLICGYRNLVLFEDVFSVPGYVASQFLFVQRYMGRCSRRAYHIIVSFDNILDMVKEKILYKMIEEVGEAVLNLYPEYQSIYVVHENTRNLHIHFVFNNISVFGAEPLTNKMNIFTIQRVVDEIVMAYQGII